LDSILEALPDPVLVLRPRGELLCCNQAADRLVAPFDVAPQAANRARVIRFVVELVWQGKPSAAETLILVDPLEATDLPMGATAKTAVWTNGEPVVVVTLRRDMGEKTLLIANASHELRTPLNAILGYASLLLRGVHGDISRSQRASLERVESNAHHLLALINDMLDVSLTDAGKMPLRLTTFDLSQLVRETLGELEPLIARAKLPVYSNWTLALPPISSDRGKVKQIILNLITNALKFTSAGQVRVELARVDGQASVSVTDTGIGIAPRDHKRIFEDFRQVDGTPRRAHGGAGLGLAICRRFATLLGGSISVASELGKGATFTLHLPLESNHGPSEA
jgi:signal transduction histidine kinase